MYLDPMFIDALRGMIISGCLVTADTPIDYGQWKDGKPWHWKPGNHEASALDTGKQAGADAATDDSVRHGIEGDT